MMMILKVNTFILRKAKRNIENITTICETED